MQKVIFGFIATANIIYILMCFINAHNARLRMEDILLKGMIKTTEAKTFLQTIVAVSAIGLIVGVIDVAYMVIVQLFKF
jgi:hypothetical protein